MLSRKTLFLISYLRGVGLDLKDAVYAADDELQSVVVNGFLYQTQKYLKQKHKTDRRHHIRLFFCPNISDSVWNLCRALCTACDETPVKPLITKVLLKHTAIGINPVI